MQSRSYAEIHVTRQFSRANDPKVTFAEIFTLLDLLTEWGVLNVPTFRSLSFFVCSAGRAQEPGHTNIGVNIETPTACGEPRVDSILSK